MIIQVQNEIVVCIILRGRRLLATSLFIYLLVYMCLWLFPVAYLGRLKDLPELISTDCLLSSLLVTVFIVLLAVAFLFIKVRKQLTKTKKKAVWQIIVIHVVVVISEYLLLNMLAKDARLSALSIMFQIVSVGFSRILASPNMVFRVVLIANINLLK